MIEAWILTVTLWVAQGGVSNQYVFATREKCIAAQTWYTQRESSRVIQTTCYPSLIKK